MNKKDLETVLKDTGSTTELEAFQSLSTDEQVAMANKIHKALNERDALIKAAAKFVSVKLDEAMNEGGFDQATFFLAVESLLKSISENPKHFGLPPSLLKRTVDETAEILRGTVYIADIRRVFREVGNDGSVN